MIEINLLPEDIRTTEGTPPKRFALYIGFIMLVLLLGFYIIQYRHVNIPNMAKKIELDKLEVIKLTKMREDIDKVTLEIDGLNKKIADLDELNLSRVKFARLFDRLTNAMPEGVWFRSFTFAPDASVSTRYQPAGRRYSVTMTGSAVGTTSQERDHKVTELLSNLEKQLNIPPENAPVPLVIPEDYGFCKFIGARFEKPKPSGINSMPLPVLTGIDPKLVKQINVPAEGADFSIQIVFDMPLPKVAL